MTAKLTRESRDAISRAWFFLEKAKGCPNDARVDFEAFLEAAIVFARAAVHRLKAKYEHHRQWKAWWDSLRDDPTVEFFRTERDWLLKQASPKVGQIMFLPTIGGDQPAYVPTAASEFYYFEAATPATATVERHLVALEQRLTEAEQHFSSVSGMV